MPDPRKTNKSRKKYLELFGSDVTSQSDGADVAELAKELRQFLNGRLWVEFKALGVDGALRVVNVGRQWRRSLHFLAIFAQGKQRRVFQRFRNHTGLRGHLLDPTEPQKDLQGHKALLVLGHLFEQKVIRGQVLIRKVEFHLLENLGFRRRGLRFVNRCADRLVGRVPRVFNVHSESIVCDKKEQAVLSSLCLPFFQSRLSAQKREKRDKHVFRPQTLTR